jgi:hypothetical protein
MKKLVAFVLISASLTQPALSGVCDYRPSQLIGKGTTGAVAGAAGATAVTGGVAKAAGIYTITHATTGAAMLGSTAAGASAAGTTGIIAGSAGLLGTAGAILLSPFVLIPAAVTAVGVSAYEGGCYLSDK